MTDHDPSTAAEIPDTTEELLRLQRQSIPEPDYEHLKAFARGQLGADDTRAVEAALAIYPELQALVDALKSPDKVLHAAVERGMRVGLAGLRRPWWKSLALPVGAAATVAVALLVFRSPHGEVLPAPGALTFESTLRSEREIRQFRQGDKLTYELLAPEGSRRAYLLEVSGRQVELVAELDAQPGVAVPQTLVMDGDDTVSFLVVIFSEERPEAESLIRALSKEASSGPLLSEVAKSSRDRRVENALAGVGLRLRVSVSTLLQVKP